LAFSLLSFSLKFERIREREERETEEKKTNKKKDIILERNMAVSSASFRVVTFLILIIAALMTVASSQVTAPAPAPTSDGNSLYSGFHSCSIAFCIIL